MKLSCLPVSFFSEIIEGRMSIFEWAQMGASIGLDAIDISILFAPDHTPQKLAAVRREVESTGMRILMVTSYPDFTHPDAAQRERELALEQEVVAVGAALGAQYVRVTAGQAHPETGRAEGVAWAIQGLRRLAESTRTSGITLVYENHAKPGAWTYTDFSQPPELFLEIARATADAGIGVNFDTGNAATFADDPVELLRAVIGQVITIHAADSSRRGELKHVLLGTGITPYPALFSELKKCWLGWLDLHGRSIQPGTRRRRDRGALHPPDLGCSLI